MPIPKLKKQNILDALKYIDENGVLRQNQSTRYKLVINDGKEYPPKYVIAVAAHIANGTDISTEDYNAVEAKKYLQNMGFKIVTKYEKFELTITADSIVSTDECFTMDNLGLGDNYIPLDAYFKKANGEVIRRKYSKGERRSSNQTLPRIAFQIYEKQIASMSVEEKENFPICQYRPTSEMIRGIFTSVEAFKKYRKTLERMIYSYDNGRQFVIYSWNVFSTIIFVQECLKRFGEPGDQFVLIYREKEENEKTPPTLPDDGGAGTAAAGTTDDDTTGSGTTAIGTTGGVPAQSHPLISYLNPYSSMLLESKNIIFRGAPGTGKTYLAREIAADIISNGYFKDYELLTDEQKKQIEFVQFHPNYDYSDFIEGLRPKINDDGSMGFELQDGIFKKFVDRARKNYENSQKSSETIEKELSVQESMTAFFDNINFDVDTFKTINGNEFTITNADDKHVYVSIPKNAIVNKLCLSLDDIRKMLESGQKFDKIKDMVTFFGKTFHAQAYSYEFAIYKAIKSIKSTAKIKAQPEELKKYVFIIDEINRGEISKIFGELFFAIDPGYRGRAGEVSTQYSNLHSDPNEKFYIPANVYIIGTMNDIDRSVDSFDFAMRRRFRFVELKADETLEMLSYLENEELENEAIRRMSALNAEIANIEDLNENYQIGAAYFLKLKSLSFDQLWTDYLKPLLQDYIQGMQDEEGIMNKFAKAFEYKPADGDVNEAAQN